LCNIWNTALQALVAVWCFNYGNSMML